MDDQPKTYTREVWVREFADGSFEIYFVPPERVCATGKALKLVDHRGVEYRATAGIDRRGRLQTVTSHGTAINARGSEYLHAPAWR